MWMPPMLLNRGWPHAVSFMLAIMLVVVPVFMPTPVMAAIETYSFANDNEATRFHELIKELRCPKCQNQSLADSDSMIAIDLRSKVKSMLDQGRSDEDIRVFMVQRYGDFILYDPPFNTATLVLWLSPVLLVLLGGVFLWRLQRRQRVIAKDLSLREKNHLQAILNFSDSQQSAQEPRSE